MVKVVVAFVNMLSHVNVHVRSRVPELFLDLLRLLLMQFETKLIFNTV